MHFIHRFLLIISCSIFSFSAFAQIDGDNIFNQDQIITIELEFSQVGFWDSLVLNYETTVYMNADLTLTDSTGTYSFPNVGVRLKGNSSYGHPGQKKSFKIDFNKYVSGQDYDGLKKLNFSNSFKDPSLLREKVFFDLSRTVGVPAPRANFANVYFNGELWGFYTVIEQIDDQFLDWRILDDDGNLFKAGANFGGGPGGGGNAADLKYYGEDQLDYEERYELKSNEDENDWSDLIDFTNFVDNSTTQEFESNAEDHIDMPEYIKTIALDNLFSNLDSYTGSARNYYIYHNLTTEKWEWIKWDGNESFGSYGGGGGGPGGGQNMTTLDIDHRDNDRPLLDQVFNSTIYFDQYKAELCSITDDYFNSAYMDDKIEKLKNLIESSVLADNNKMYTNANFLDNVDMDISTGGGPGGGNVYGLKSFVEAKNNHINSVLDCSIFSSIKVTEDIDFTISPNPVHAEFTIEWELNENNREISLFNALGSQVFSKSNISSSNFTVDISDLSSGIYYIQVKSTNSNVVSMSKLMKL